MSLFRSVATFQNEIKVYLLKGNLNQALSSIHRFVDQIFCEPINTAQIFGSKLLDDLCQEIGALNLRMLKNDTSSSLKRCSQNEDLVVYIVSKLQASGGHTAVLSDLIRLSAPRRNVILVTGVPGGTDHASIQHRFDTSLNISFEYAPCGKHVDKLVWLQKKLLELRPSDVWLFNHHQDSVAVAAVQPNEGYKLHFYHHGDHHLCLGVYLNYADHVDIHPMGYHYCRDELGVKDNRYLPMSVKDMGGRPEALGFKCNSGLVTCTAAGFNKIEIPYFVSYMEVIPELLQVSRGRHIHIGKLSPFALKTIHKGMHSLGLPESAFIYIPFVTSVWKALHEYKVDLYLTSFPYGGARTLIEAMGAGVPLAVHSHCTSRLLGTVDMAYEEAFVWRNPRDLYDFVLSLDGDELKRLGQLSRQRYLDFHSEQIVTKCLVLGAPQLVVSPLRQDYIKDDLQQALDISNQVSCVGAIKRFLYRAYRQLKSSIA